MTFSFLSLASLVLFLMVVHTSALTISARPRALSRQPMSMRKGRPSSNIPKVPSKGAGQPERKWVEIAASEADLPQTDGKTAAIELKDDKVLMVLRKEGAWFGLGSSCTKCKFPLLKSEFDESGEALICGVCGSKFNLKTGEMTGKVEKEGVAGFFGSMMSANKGGPIESFEIRTAATGKVYAAVALK